MGSLDKIFIGILIFSLVVITGAMMIVDIGDKYDEVNLTGTSTKFGSVYNLSEELNSTSQGMKNSLFGGEVEEDDTEDSIFKGAFSSLLGLRTLFRMVGNVISSVATEMGIPTIFVTFAMIALTIAIVFGLILLIFRIKG